MKKLLSSILIGSCIFTTSFAGSGKAFIPYVNGADAYPFAADTHVHLSNITSEPVDVEITFYRGQNSGHSATGAPSILLDGDDSLSTGIITGYRAMAYDESPASGSSVKFTIYPYESIVISFSKLANDSGYGFVEWTQDADNLVSLLGVVIEQVSKIENDKARMSRTLYQLNNGNPF